MMRPAGRWLRNVFVALDRLVNAIFLGDGDETISSRIAKKDSRGKCRLCHWICKLLDRIDPRHCPDSIDWTEGRGSNRDDSFRQ